MEKWVLYALLSAVFAGFTSVIAKLGLTGISGELGLAIRTVFVFGFVLVAAIATVPRAAIGTVSADNILWLALSGLTTTASWVLYYKALKLGDVSVIALLDKGSILVAILLAWLVLKEQITVRTLLGGALILLGLVVIARR